MKITLLTANSAEFEPLADITSPTKSIYAEKHGHEFISAKHVETHRVAWERVEMWREALSGSEWLFFTGCDVAITNPSISVDSILRHRDADFYFAIDGCGLQSDSWIMRNCPATRAMLDAVLKMEGSVSNEQDALQLYLSNEPLISNFLAGLPTPRQSGGAQANMILKHYYQRIFNRSSVGCIILPPRVINAYPRQYYGSHANTKHGWHPGDFICHLPGKSLEFRIDAFKEILKL